MRFWVTRTSFWGNGIPAEGLTQGKRPRWDVRTFKTFEEYEKRLGEPFTAKGTDHEVLPGRGIRRRMPDADAWFVDIDSLEQLMAFGEKHGDLVLMAENGVQEIEIYDGYRE